MAEELLCCPFCGGNARIEEMPRSLSPEIPDFSIDANHGDRCPLAQAMAYVPMHFTEAEAIAAWNTRVTPPTLTEGAEIVERLLRKTWVPVTGDGTDDTQVLRNPDGPAAATHITTQEAELTRLRQRVAELERRAVDAVFSAKFPKERWSCGTDESGIRLTLQRQQHWIADAVKRALIHQPNGDE